MLLYPITFIINYPYQILNEHTLNKQFSHHNSPSESQNQLATKTSFYHSNSYYITFDFWEFLERKVLITST